MVKIQHEGQRRPAKPDNVAQVGQAEAHVPQGNRAPEGHEVPVVRARLHNGTHSALQRDLETAQHVVHAEGLGGRGGRRGGVVRRVGKLLAQLQVVQDEAVAVVGYAEAVRGFAVRGSSEVGADPGGQPGASVRALGQRRPVQRAQRGVNPVEVAAPVRREETVGQADLVDGEPGVARDSPRSTSKSLSEPATLLRLST